MAATYPTHTPLTVEALWAEVCVLAHDTTGRGQGVGVELSGGSWKLVADVKPDAATLAALFLPLLAPLPADRPLVIAHLAQSLDGRIAQSDGESHWITGDADLDHTHRLRALCDAVVVGADTVVHDDCRLTVRRCPGPQPTRVVLDPSGRVPPDRRVFVDGQAPTLWLCADGREDCSQPGVDCLRLPTVDGMFRPADVMALLHGRGARRVFVEGGGRTVSHLLESGCVDRLHLAVAPLLMGDGRNTLSLALGRTLSDCPRPAVSVYRMDKDWLFDCDFAQGAE